MFNFFFGLFRYCPQLWMSLNTSQHRNDSFFLNLTVERSYETKTKSNCPKDFFLFRFGIAA